MAPHPADAADGRDRPLPASFGLRLDPSVQRPRSDLLVGGSPRRAVKLSPSGIEQVERWRAGAPIGSRPKAAALARRLIDAGVAHPLPPLAEEAMPISVVIPVRDRAAGLAVTLDALAVTTGATDRGRPSEIIVVDDASLDTSSTAGVTLGRDGVRVIWRRERGGPAAARNTGWRAAAGETVAFLDADCAVEPQWLDFLAAHLADPYLGAVAPRIAAAPYADTPRWLASYEAYRSPLDLGPRAAPVGPGGRIPYVPTAALLVRRQALVDVGGLDESMTVGEDVDLVWRLRSVGWRVRYAPEVIVVHPIRPGRWQWLGQRHTYGLSAAPLAARHGSAVAPVILSPANAALFTAVLCGRRGAAAMIMVANVGRSLRKRGPLPRRTAVRASLDGTWSAASTLAEASRRVWWPLLLVGATRSGAPRRTAVMALLPLWWEWAQRRPPLNPGPWMALRVADDLAYGSGVWRGVLRSRQVGALLPRRPAPSRKRPR